MSTRKYKRRRTRKGEVLINHLLSLLVRVVVVSHDLAHLHLPPIRVALLMLHEKTVRRKLVHLTHQSHLSAEGQDHVPQLKMEQHLLNFKGKNQERRKEEEINIARLVADHLPQTHQIGDEREEIMEKVREKKFAVKEVQAVRLRIEEDDVIVADCFWK